MHVSNLCEGPSINSSVPILHARGKCCEYKAIDSKVVQHRCLGIKDHSDSLSSSCLYLYILCHLK